MNIMKHTTKITLYNSYFDINNRLSPKAILNIMQDVASFHAEKLGVGYLEMLKNNLYWVLSRIKFDIIKMPHVNQTVIVETWPHEKGRIDFDRDVRILNENGEVLVIGMSKWCVINSETRTLQRTDNVNYFGEKYCLDVNFEGKFNKISFPDTELDEKFCYTVKFSDLDQNKHMNNTNYGNIIFNAIHNKQFNHLEINFISECKENDVIKVLATTTSDGEYISATINDNVAFNAFIK